MALEELKNGTEVDREFLAEYEAWLDEQADIFFFSQLGEMEEH